MERIKTIKGTLIKALDKEQINKEVKAMYGYGTEYFIPGLVTRPYCITINKIQYRAQRFSTFEKICNEHTNKELKEMTEREIRSLIEELELY